MKMLVSSGRYCRYQDYSQLAPDACPLTAGFGGGGGHGWRRVSSRRAFRWFYTAGVSGTFTAVVVFFGPGFGFYGYGYPWWDWDYPYYYPYPYYDYDAYYGPRYYGNRYYGNPYYGNGYPPLRTSPTD